MVYAISKRIIWPILRLFINKIEGLENLPDKPFILVSNHSSYADGVLLIMLVAWYKNKQLRTFAVKEDFTGPIWNWLFNHFGAIRVNGSLKKGVNAIKKDKTPLCIFPEGGRTSTGKVQKVTHTGLGVLALETKAPVVPVAMNTFRWWSRHRKLPTLRRNINIIIGKPKKYRLKNTKANARKIVAKVMKEVKQRARKANA